jgi:hypothetical protein
VDIPSWSWLQLRIKLQEIYILKRSFHGMPDEAEEKNFEADDFESEFETI